MVHLHQPAYKHLSFHVDIYKLLWLKKRAPIAFRSSTMTYFWFASCGIFRNEKFRNVFKIVSFQNDKRMLSCQLYVSKYFMSLSEDPAVVSGFFLFESHLKNGNEI